MFEVAELGHKVSKADYNEKVPTLRTQLLTVQQQLRDHDYSVIILISGVDGGGKGEVINLLNEWLDPRFMRTNAYDSPSDEEKERPVFWRYWRTMPAKGTIGIYVGSWYSNPIAQRVYGKISDAELKLRLTKIKELEQELADDNTLIIKCWLHLKQEQQKKRLKQLEKNPETAWQVTDRDKKHLKMYATFAGVAEDVLNDTSSAQNPWLIVEGSDIRYSSLTVGQHILDKIKSHIDNCEQKQNTPAPSQLEKVIHGNQPSLLDKLDLNQSLDKDQYNEQLNFYHELNWPKGPELPPQ